jgi:hypothetical protein
MNKSRFMIGLLLVAVLVMFAPTSHAQTATNCQSAGSTINCNVIAVGSSAIFPSAAIAAVNGDPQRGVSTPLCGTRFWSGSASGRDSRKTLTTPNLVDEPGTLWVAWDNDSTPTIVCAYLSVDSLVGQRLFYGQGSGASGPTNNGQLIIPTAACSAAGANKVSFIWDTATTGIPPAVYNALQGTTGTSCSGAGLPVNFTTASTDVSPADALFVGNQRVLGPDSAATPDFPTDGKTGLGYGGTSCTAPGPAFASSYETSTIANPVCYTFVGGQSDPISGTVIPSSQIVSEGALAMLPLIGLSHNASGSGGFGDLFANKGFNNVLSSDIAAGYAKSTYGTATLTRNLFTGSNAGSISVAVAHFLAREPMSGTYTTWEWQVIRNKESALTGGGLSQETNVCAPSPSPQNTCYFTPSNNAAACPSQATNLTNLVFPNAYQCSNYMSWGTPSFAALKTRVLGTGEMVKVLNVNGSATCSGFPAFPCITDTFGYAFWSLGTFGGKSNVAYLQLDGVDGLYGGYSSAVGGNNGIFPAVPPAQGTNPAPGAAPANGCAGYYNGNGGTIQSFACSSTNPWPFPTFANVINGNYRAWSINRVVWYLPSGATSLNPVFTTAGLNAPGFWLSAADQTAPVISGHGAFPDFLPFGYCASAAACPSGSAPTLTYPLNAFRSHYGVGGINPNNGITGSGFGGTEAGGDVAGKAVTVQAEADSVNFFGSTFSTWIQ